jgi:hypothetical protein
VFVLPSLIFVTIGPAIIQLLKVLVPMSGGVPR